MPIWLEKQGRKGWKWNSTTTTKSSTNAPCSALDSILSRKDARRRITTLRLHPNQSLVNHDESEIKGDKKNTRLA